MPGINWIPGISQIKAGLQLITGDFKGAAQTTEDFVRECPGFSQITSVAQLIDGDKKGALETQKRCLRTISNVVDGMPVVGHVKGIIHHAVGDQEGGDKALNAATRSTAVIGSGVVAGIATGGLGSIPAGIAAGGAYDMAHSVITNKPQGLVAAIGNVIENPSAGTIVDAAMIYVGDGLGGHAGGKSAVGKNMKSAFKSLKADRRAKQAQIDLFRKTEMTFAKTQSLEYDVNPFTGEINTFQHGTSQFSSNPKSNTIVTSKKTPSSAAVPAARYRIVGASLAQREEIRQQEILEERRQQQEEERIRGEEGERWRGVGRRRGKSRREEEKNREGEEEYIETRNATALKLQMLAEKLNENQKKIEERRQQEYIKAKPEPLNENQNQKLLEERRQKEYLEERISRRIQQLEKLAAEMLTEKQNQKVLEERRQEDRKLQMIFEMMDYYDGERRKEEFIQLLRTCTLISIGIILISLLLYYLMTPQPLIIPVLYQPLIIPVLDPALSALSVNHSTYIPMGKLDRGSLHLLLSEYENFQRVLRNTSQQLDDSFMSEEQRELLYSIGRTGSSSEQQERINEFESVYSQYQEIFTLQEFTIINHLRSYINSNYYIGTINEEGRTSDVYRIGNNHVIRIETVEHPAEPSIMIPFNMITSTTIQHESEIRLLLNLPYYLINTESVFGCDLAFEINNTGRGALHIILRHSNQLSQFIPGLNVEFLQPDHRSSFDAIEEAPTQKKSAAAIDNFLPTYQDHYVEQFYEQQHRLIEGFRNLITQPSNYFAGMISRRSRLFYRFRDGILLRIGISGDTFGDSRTREHEFVISAYLQQETDERSNIELIIEAGNETFIQGPGW